MNYFTFYDNVNNAYFIGCIETKEVCRMTRRALAIMLCGLNGETAVETLESNPMKMFEIYLGGRVREWLKT